MSSFNNNASPFSVGDYVTLNNISSNSVYYEHYRAGTIFQIKKIHHGLLNTSYLVYTDWFLSNNLKRVDMIPSIPPL